MIFVSHATADKWIAKRVCEAIEAAGATTFRDDRDLDGGDSIPDEIRRKLKEAHELVVLITPNSVNRPWVLLEVGAFWGRRAGVRIVPVLYLVTVDSIPDMISAKKAVFLNDFDDFLEGLKRRLAKAKRK